MTNSSNYGTTYPNPDTGFPSLSDNVCDVKNSKSGEYNHASTVTSNSGYYKASDQWLPNVEPNPIGGVTAHSNPSNAEASKPWTEVTMTCPTCLNGEKQVIVNKGGKKYIDLTDQFTRWPQAVRMLIGKFQDLANSGAEAINELYGTISVAKVNDLWWNNQDDTCPTCSGYGVIEDPSGQTGINAQAAGEELNAAFEDIANSELDAGGAATGNRYTVIAGYDCLDVGLGMNSTKSYRIDPSGHNPGHVGVDVPQVEVLHKSPFVQGTNPPATPGGHYIIKCSNKFTCFTGAQGIELISHGPINIAGGQIKVSGPEVTIGSSTGPVNVSGHHLQLNGQTIAMKPTGLSAQVVVQGSMGITGNIVLGGGAHVDGDLSFTSGTSPSKLSRTKYSSAVDMNTGPATWSGYSGEWDQGQAYDLEFENYYRTVWSMVNDPSLLADTYRGQMVVSDHMDHFNYLVYVPEYGSTGYCTPLTSSGEYIPVIDLDGYLMGYIWPYYNMTIYNYPHQHQLFDGVHTHEMEVPNINLYDTAEQVRKSAYTKASPVPVPATQVTDVDLMYTGPLYATEAADEGQDAIWMVW